MFGHLRVKSCSLEERDREIYRSHFCSVCHNLHAFGGWDASLLTNYDVTLWSLVASGVSAKDYNQPIAWKPCTALPFRKVEVQPLSQEMGASLSAITILLVAAKLQDARQDGKRFLGALGQAWLGKREAKARDYLFAKAYPLEALLELPARQAEAERDEEPSLPKLAAPTQAALSDAFSWIAKLGERDDLEAPLRALGSEIAYFVYLWDALEDGVADLEKGDFNALHAVLGSHFSAGPVRSELLGSLQAIDSWIGQLPLGDRRKLCLELTKTLRGKVGSHPALVEAAANIPTPRHLLRRAGFVHANCDGCDCPGCDCGGCDGCSGCDVGCCDSPCEHCGSTPEGCKCVECNVCDCSPGDACCEFECCDSCDCCDCDCCDKGEPRPKKRGDCGCLPQAICCFAGSQGAKNARIPLPDRADSEPAEPKERGTVLCPGCRQDTFEVQLPEAKAHLCRDCGGVWLDGNQGHLPRVNAQDLAGLRQGAERPPGIRRGQRLCPHCKGLLRTPYEAAHPESCDTCYGEFYSAEQIPRSS